MSGKGKQENYEFLYCEFHWRQPTIQVVRKDNWKAIKLSLNSEMQLYNLSEDISEVYDVADAHPEIIKEMKKIFKKARISNDRWELK